MEYESKLVNLLGKMDIALTDWQIHQFIKYYEMLIEKNKVMNLTAITDYDEVIEKHFADSLSLIKIYDLTQNIKLVDLGTGAGFPGLPLKIVFPNLNIVLMDSLNKRVTFLKEVIDALQLKDITAIHGRAEDLGKEKMYRETFDIGVSRAVAKLSVLSEYCIPFIKVGGSFISYKAGSIEEELDDSKKAITVLGGKIDKTEYFKLPDTDIERTLIRIKKVNRTPGIYPRTAGKPAKEPIT